MMAYTMGMDTGDFSANLFWDVDPETLDFEQHQRYVVARVLERGSLNDWNVLVRLLSLDTVVRIAQSLRTLDDRTLAFLCAVSGATRESFRCYASKPLSRKHWIS